MTGLARTETAIKSVKPKDKPYMLRGTTADSGCLLYQAAGSIGDCVTGWMGRKRKSP